MIRVAVIDNDKLVPTGLRALIEPMPEIELVCTSTRVEDYLAAGVPVDVVLLDLLLDDGVPPARNVDRIRATGARVLMMSVRGERHYVRDTIRAGACGYLIKDDDGAKLADAIRAVHAGQRALTPELAFIINLQPPKLSRRELQVLYYYGTGCTLEATAHRLGIGVTTVREYLRRIYAKFAAAGDPVAGRDDLTPRLRDYHLPDNPPGGRR